jgi:hypothetical protein
MGAGEFARLGIDDDARLLANLADDAASVVCIDLSAAFQQREDKPPSL